MKKVETSRCMRKTSRIRAERIPNTDVFECSINSANAVYAYDSVISNHQGKHTARVMLFLLPRSRSGFFCSAKVTSGNLRQLGAQLRTIDGVPGTSSPSGRRTRSASASLGISQLDRTFSRLRLLGGIGRMEFYSRRRRRAHYKSRSVTRPENKIGTLIRSIFLGCAQQRPLFGTQKIQVDR